MKTKLFLSVAAIAMAFASVTTVNAFNFHHFMADADDTVGYVPPACNIVDENGQPVADNAFPDAGSLYDNLYKGPSVSKCVNLSKLDNAPTTSKDGALRKRLADFWIIMLKPGQIPTA